MAFINLPFGVRITVEFTLNGKTVAVVHWVKSQTDAVYGTATLEALANLTYDAYVLEWQPVAAQEAQIDDIYAVGYNAANGPIRGVTGGRTFPVIGAGIASTAMPNNVALVASLRTGLTGRSFRGRNYTLGWAETNVIGNDVTAATQVAVADLYTELITGYDLINYDLVVASFQAGGVPRANGVGTPVSQVLVNSRVDTQRRRLPA